MFSPEQFHEIMAKDRQGMLNLINEYPQITLLPPENRGRYLIGTAKHKRAICLAWGETKEEGHVDMDSILQAYEEIAHTGLTIPFLFYCRTTSIFSEGFRCMQIPIVFENNALIPTLRTLNFRGLPQQIRFHGNRGDLDSPAIEQAQG